MAQQRLEEQVRTRLRAARTARGLTLEDVARRSSLSPSTVSRLESGARRLTLDHLPALAAAIGVDVGELLAPRPADPRVRTAPRTIDGTTVWPLSILTPPGGLQAYKIAFSADRKVSELRTHEGHEWLYVLSGRLRLLLGDDELILEPGEAAEFATLTPHWLGAVDGPTEALIILGPHGERVHLLTP